MVSDASDQPALVALPVVANARRLIVFFIVLALVAAASFIAGTFVRAPQQSALDSVSEQLEVTYAVEERVVAPGVTLPGRVVSGETRQLTVASGTGTAERLIVTRQALVAGQMIAPGTMLGEVSGRPQISIPEGVPLYRNFVDGSTGADVTAFQSALQHMGLDVSVTGEVGPRTLAAVLELYERFDAAPVAPTVIVWSEFLPVSAGATVVTSAAVGAVLTPELPLAVVKVSPDVVLARANVLEADELAVGQAVQLRSGTGTAASTVLRIGEFTTPEDNSGAGRDVTMELPADFVVTESAPITVSADGDAGTTPAVPVLALRQDDKGTYVELPNASGEPSGQTPANAEDRERIYITVTAQAEGWAAIESGGQLAIGTEVLVSP
ncbi:hypothetical protein [Salinibacterium sp.]|uniref:hypothetical protein n=1 Tax=Salinibacterium sp. TaxID=1915057 RepID=UPI00286CFEE3|nr:hypothetical protein [Salinibacterium sp.]